MEVSQPLYISSLKITTVGDLKTQFKRLAECITNMGQEVSVCDKLPYVRFQKEKTYNLIICMLDDKLTKLD